MTRKTLPRAVVPFANSGCWIVGSSAQPDDKLRRDIDILVPYELWPNVAALIPEDARPNRQGGWKFTIADEELAMHFELDVWPDSLARFLGVTGSSWAWHPLSDRYWSWVELSKEDENA